jgi:hypothetical protein
MMLLYARFLRVSIAENTQFDEGEQKAPKQGVLLEGHWLEQCQLVIWYHHPPRRKR